mmetsp:Transcript_39359/g.47712  ORF Transcript_39359/g.47712 Transcript_39359/m.47712 type:complete len:364 (-) Transcript_39359:345-1436(-)|eukprot:CAMPEP_0197851222 /NCGR_PEP_ID=MMETSP1438-20131217/17573_1 /TAXON_ID=1461541 /ORGANISM="Pterosperma sp., Strain CCMP1384" /LENGTH=363 /DNA_ID=CAMNT_0043464749 /DNA_START=171 /DNA_END=1262 /DNA_ORIENTATION=+
MSEASESEEKGYLGNTAVQPKPVTRGEIGETVYRNSEQDHVRHAFNQGNYVGIRSLPNAMAPDFRQQIYEQVISDTKKHSNLESGYGTGGRPDATRAEPLSTGVASGQRKPGTHSAAPNAFSNYEYKHSEYEREKELRATEQRLSKEMWIAKHDFKCTALPPIPKSVGSFNEFEYSIEPFEASEDMAKTEKKNQDGKILHGAVKAGGRIQSVEQIKVRLNEVMKLMEASVKKDWTKSFLSVFEDTQGLVVLCFDKDKVEGDLTAYMNQFFRTSGVVSEFSLRRDTTRWGVVEEGVPNVYYVFIPPWVHIRIQHPELSAVPDKEPVPGLREPPLMSGRVPFCPQTESGNQVHLHIRTYPNSFRY